MEKKLSIIVPSYNVEKYLNILLDSLLVDKSIVKDLEIIIVNDGSKDRTLEIAYKYEKMYPDSIIVIDKLNGGHGSGINVGVSKATGKYFKVIDSDDWVEINGIKELLNAIEKTEADLFVNPYKMVWEGGETKKIDYELIEKDALISFADLNALNYLVPLHAFTIKTSILKEKVPMLDEGIFYDDIEHVLFPVPYITTIMILNEALYCYRLGRPGQSVAMVSYVKNIKHFEKMFNSIALYYQTNYNHMSDQARRYYLHMTYDMFSKLINIYLYIGNNVARKRVNELFSMYSFLYLENMKSRKIQFLRISKGIGFWILRCFEKKNHSA